MAVLAQMKERELGQEQQDAPCPPSHEGQEDGLPAPVELVLRRVQ